MLEISKLSPLVIFVILVIVLYSTRAPSQHFKNDVINIVNTTVAVETIPATPLKPATPDEAVIIPPKNETKPIEPPVIIEPTKPDEAWRHVNETRPPPAPAQEENNSTAVENIFRNITLPTVDWVPQIAVYQFPREHQPADPNFEDKNHIYKVIIAIPSGPTNTKRRDVLRKKWLTWTNTEIGPELERIKTASSRPFPDCLVRFFVARPADAATQEQLDREQEEYGDIIEFTHFPDSYRNLGWKTIAIVQWIEMFMKGRYDFLYKVDDDVFVHLPRMLNLLDNTEPTNVYLGFDGGIFIPDKNKKSKWYFPPEDAPKAKFHFCCGPGYVLSHDVVRKFVVHINGTAFFVPIFLEDVNTAWVMYQIKVPVKGNTRMANHDRCSANLLQLHGAYTLKQDDLFRAVNDKAKNMCSYLRPNTAYKNDS